MKRAHHLLLGLASATLLTACGDGPPPAAQPPSTTAPAPSPSAAPTTAASTESPLRENMREAYEAAVAAHPRADLGKCGRSTPLDDRACGAALNAAGAIAADTARRLRASAGEHAQLLYGGIFDIVNSLQESFEQLRSPIPCYGLSDAPQPPAPLRAEAQSICAEAADIAKAKWRIFITQVG